MARARVTVYLDAETDSKLASVGNASAYICAIVRQRWREWLHAATTLHSLGWTSARTMTALGDVGADWEAAVVSDHYLAIQQRVGCNTDEARLLVKLAAEHYAGNPAVGDLFATWEAGAEGAAGKPRKGKGRS